MDKNLSNYLTEFDKIYKSNDNIDQNFYKDAIGVTAFNNKASVKDRSGNLSEEYIRARFVWALVNSGLYNKEYICVEFGFPKGNTKTQLKPDIVVFKNKDWLKDYEEAKIKKDFSKIRQNVLVIFETKKNNKSVDSAVENQLRSAMIENESKDAIYGVYFDDRPDILIFEKVKNTKLRRYDNDKNKIFGNLNLDKRDFLNSLPSQKDFKSKINKTKNLSSLKYESLNSIDESNFTEIINSLKRANDSIKPTHGDRELIVEFLTLKVFDEKRIKKNNECSKFYITEDEKKQLESFRERVQSIYKDAIKEYANVIGSSKRLFKYNEKLIPNSKADEGFLIKLVEEFQEFAILKGENASFNQIIFNNFGSENQKDDKGQFFTPIPVVKNIIKLLNPIKSEELCDPCCGICDFPAMAFRETNKNDKYKLATNFYGFDIAPSNLKLAELNLVINGDGGAVLKDMDSLSQKLLANNTVLDKSKFTTEYYNDDWSHKKYNDDEYNLKKFKIVATNPPFGKGRDLKTGAKSNWDLPKETVELYETYKIKKSPKKNGQVNYPKSMDKGALFLENAYKILDEGGRMGIVLSNSIASIKEWQNVRKWFIERMRIVATFDLPANTFGETGVATTVIIAYKPKSDEMNLLKNDYEVFVKEVQNIGYEVKTVKRSIEFKPQYIINEETFEKTSDLLEDFSTMQSEFKEFLKRQEEEIKNAFHLDKMG